MLLRVFILTLLMLAGCQTIDADSTPTTAPDKYEAVIDGGLGINFSDPLSKLIKMGFEETRGQQNNMKSDSGIFLS